MEADESSTTALGTAFMRAYHAAHDRPTIFHDPLAHRLLTPEECQEREERYLKGLQTYFPDEAAACPDRASALACWMQTLSAPAIVFARAQYNEDLLEEAVRMGVRQYVILGAGMDTFALRRPDLLEQLQVFEVDHPATQAQKRRRLREAGLEPPAQVHFLALDFSREDLTTALRRSSFDPQVPTFFSWLGVTYYLPREAVWATWGAVAEMAPAGSALVFDYLDREAFVPGQVARRVEVMLDLVKRVGEPMVTGFAPETLAAELAGLGFRLQEDLSPDEIHDRFFQGRTDGYRASEHARFAWAVVT